jgi:DNA polymerase III subunit beta
MNIKIQKDKLISILNKAERVTNKNTNLPILVCVLFELKNGELSISATNLDIGFLGKIKVNTKEEGVFAVEGVLISQFLNNLSKSEDEVEIILNESILNIKTKNSATKIKTQNPEDFPPIPEIKSSKTVKINSNQFMEGLKSVWYSSSVSNIKPELSSVLIYNNSEDLIFVATDSYRLAEKKLKIAKIEEFENILIPYKNVVEIIKIIEDLDDEMEIIFDQDQIAFKTEKIFIITRIVNGSFPDYKQILPKEFKTKITLLKQDFIQQLKITNIFSDKFNQVTLEVDKDKSKMMAFSENQEKGDSLNEINIKIEGDSVKANFNHKYISDCFSSIDSDTLTLEFNGTNKPLVIRGLKDNSFTYLVMPLNK